MMSSRSDSPPRRATVTVAPALWVILALVGVTLGIYAQTLGFEFINFDDTQYVTENARIRQGLNWPNVRWAFSTFETGNWHPLTWLSLMLDAQLFGLNAGGFHLTNVLLHLLASICLFAWLRDLLATARPAWPRNWPAALVALLFAAHPLHVESVAWVTERKDVLAALGLFAALWSWTRYARATEIRGPSCWLPYLVSVLCFAVGLMSKSMIVTLPALLLLLDLWPLCRWRVLPGGNNGVVGRGAGWLLVEKLPFIGLASVACILTTFAARQGSALTPFPWGQRALGAAAATLVYLGRTLWPAGLSPCYGYPMLSWSTAQLSLALAALVSLTVLICWQWQRRPYLLVGWLWYLVVLLPVSGIVPVGNQPVPDRYSYLPHVGLFLMLAGAVVEAVRTRPRLRVPLAAVCALGVAGCAWVSWRQTAYWYDGITLFERALSLAPPANRGARVRANQLLGDAYLRAGRAADAEGRYADAVSLYSNDAISLGKLGYICVLGGRWQEAADFLKRALAAQPNDIISLNSLGVAYRKLGQTDAAREAFRRCLEMDARYPLAHFHLAQLSQADGDLAGATQHYEAALAVRPDWPAALAALAWLDATREAGDLERALLLAKFAVELTRGEDPTSLDVLAAAFAAHARWDEAIATARDALAATRKSAGSDARTTIAAQESETAARQARLERYQRHEKPALP